ncbi:hypothetical protein N799_05275 [Lysobacter arseniciresistens ZS79]|uniref:Pili assembly chaperone N-terminal domain-containing protein n=1 Tax=Lysobacter arseniciresistens ZS79 TaxID=913325 RepID=A0A0A0F4N8_9GAMM|nr:fimbria/pilus periplasmic chaperone [Lysobacter arseniciresistens]KGM57480.1 hypothetical protein N799_05275 [Lysobacter arseniciresistens ZS79]
MFKRIIITIFALSVASFSAHAVQVRPMYSEYAPSKKAGVLTVANTDKTEKTFQVIVERQLFEGGVRKSVKTTDLRFAPSIFKVPAGKVQTVRWALNAAATSADEQMYVITVKEVPDPAVIQLPGVHHLIDVKTAWIWRPEGLAPQLSARWDGGVLVVKNTGNASARLVDLVAGTVNKTGQIGYVFPGEEARFDVDGKAKVAVSVKVNGKDVILDAK